MVAEGGGGPISRQTNQELEVQEGNTFVGKIKLLDRARSLAAGNPEMSMKCPPVLLFSKPRSFSLKGVGEESRSWVCSPIVRVRGLGWRGRRNRQQGIVEVSYIVEMSGTGPLAGAHEKTFPGVGGR
jgi:hypothetical protein